MFISSPRRVVRMTRMTFNEQKRSEIQSLFPRFFFIHGNVYSNFLSVRRRRFNVIASLSIERKKVVQQLYFAVRTIVRE